MKKNSIFLIFLICLSPFLQADENPLSSCGVTYTFSGGRLGDNLLAYLHAKWISYKYELPLYYKPFPFSEEFILSDVELPYKKELATSFPALKTLKEEKDLLTKSVKGTLWTIPYFPESKVELATGQWIYFPVDWEDEGFKTVIRQVIVPKNPFHYTPLPTDKVTVAVHVRKGGGIDPVSCHPDWPFKFPPDSYYIEQIKRIHDIFKGEPLYVYLFTDDLNPQRIAEKYQKAVGRTNIEYAFRKEGNTPTNNILEDLFDMIRYDCLIRGDSNFAIIASKLTDYKVLIKPAHHFKKKGIVVIDKVDVIQK